MPDITASFEYLQNLPLYRREKPYWMMVAPHKGIDPDVVRLDNLEWEEHHDIKVLSYDSKTTCFDNEDDVAAYKKEMENLLKDELGAVFVNCYDLRLRKNVTFERSEIDLKDPLLIEGPARGVHIDATSVSGPDITNSNLSDEVRSRYLNPGFRVQIINTWRPLLPVIENNPLALCDCRSVSPTDLMAADRVVPNKVGEVYYLKHNPQHKWYWVENQKSSELFMFKMYDTWAGNDNARYCPHVSFENIREGPDAPRRESVETRSIVISRVPAQGNHNYACI